MIIALKKILVKAHLYKHYEYEESEFQEISIDIETEIENEHCSLLEQTIDYAKLEADIVSLVKSRQFVIIEQVASAIADFVIANTVAHRVAAKVAKAGVLQHTEEAFVVAERALEKVFLALGSNLGDRALYIKNGIDQIKSFVGVQKISSIQEYPALLPEGAPKEWNAPYLNCVLWGYTSLGPKELLACCKSVEHGRQQQKWAPRGLDVDIILYGNKIVINKELTIPHPDFLKREFVINPMREIAPEMFVAYESAI